MVLANSRGIKAHASGTQTSTADIPVSGEPSSDTCPTFRDCAVQGRSFPQEISHIHVALLAHPGKVYGVLDALPAAAAGFPLGGDKGLGFQGLYVDVDLSVIHADPPGDVSGGVTIGVLGQIPDNGSPQGVGIENGQGVSNLWGQSWDRLVDAGHSIILAYLHSPMNLQHLLSDANIIIKVMLSILRARPNPEKGDQT